MPLASWRPSAGVMAERSECRDEVTGRKLVYKRGELGCDIGGSTEFVCMANPYTFRTQLPDSSHLEFW